ncbi:FCD domain-containing protein [Desulfovibrio aminophilus]|nr:FCD domain-containing protein [Desulfovibrio aminophilus]
MEVRPGSGCYLRSRHEARTPDADAVDWSSRLEACYITFPRIAALCTERISAAGIAALELRLMELSRALFARNPDALREHLNGFARDIARGADNPALRAVVEALCPGNSPLFGIIFQLQDYEREMIFGDTAKVVQAMKRRDAQASARCMEERILRLAALLERHGGVPLSPLLRGEGERLEVFG